MSVAAAEGGFGELGGEGQEASASTIAGATTFFILVVSAICMWQGADAQRMLLTASLTMIFFALLNYAPAVGAGALLIYLGAVGGLKRYMIPIFGYSSFDTLLLVGPMVVGLLFANRLIQRDIPRDTRLSKLVFAMLIVMLLQVANPLQGGLAIGLSGLLFYVVPLLWFYVGRQFGTWTVRASLLQTAIVLVLLGGIYGLCQQFFGFTDVEKQWFALTGNDRALYLNTGAVRVFSFFSSFSEYVHFLGMGTVICCAGLLRRNRLYALPFTFLLGTLLLSSSRGGLLGALAACVMMWAIQGRSTASWAPRLVLAAVVAGAALFFGLSSIQKGDAGNSTTSALLTHQANGILAPTNQKASTGGDHLVQTAGGVLSGFRNPLGSGLGSTTIATGKFGGKAAGTEFDISDMFSACGLLGGLIYVSIVITCFARSLGRWRKDRDMVSLATLALLATTIGFWLQGAHYGTTMLLWFLVGGIDRMDVEELRREKAGKTEAGAPTEKPEFQGRVWRGSAPGGIGDVPYARRTFVTQTGEKD